MENVIKIKTIIGERGALLTEEGRYSHDFCKEFLEEYERAAMTTIAEEYFCDMATVIDGKPFITYRCKLTALNGVCKTGLATGNNSEMVIKEAFVNAVEKFFAFKRLNLFDNELSAPKMTGTEKQFEEAAIETAKAESKKKTAKKEKVKEKPKDETPVEAPTEIEEQADAIKSMLENATGSSEIIKSKKTDPIETKEEPAPVSKPKTESTPVADTDLKNVKLTFQGFALTRPTIGSLAETEKGRKTLKACAGMQAKDETMQTQINAIKSFIESNEELFA